MTQAQEWLHSRRWGVFFHYLNGLQNNAQCPNSDGKQTDWDTCVHELDVGLLAEQLHEVNAGYAAITVMQGTEHMIAPNAVYDAVTGYAPGEACSTRDLIADLIDALDRYDIPLLLYYTGDGPCRGDARAAIAFDSPAYGGLRCASPAFVDKWTAVLREYSVRYGKAVRGWWVDGLYPAMYPGVDNPLIGRYKEAARAGNPDALFSANYYGCAKSYPVKAVPGIGDVIFGDFYQEIAPPTRFCDFTAGELVCFNAYPQEKDVEGALPHLFSFMGIPETPVKVYEGWGRPGSKYTSEYLSAYIRCCHALGGVVTVDCCLHRDGSVDNRQLEVLRAMNF